MCLQDISITAPELSKKVYNILEHISGCHEECDESWCYDERAMKQNKMYTAPAEHRIDKEKDKDTYNQLLKVFQ